MTTKEIRTSRDQIACDVCGRTLLRGEEPQTYIAGGTRREVCELCEPRAAREGWVRDDAMPAPRQPAGRGERRASLLDRLRQRRERARGEGAATPDPLGEAGADAVAEESDGDGQRFEARQQPAHEPLPATFERRDVHAVPSGSEQRIAATLEAFNASEHPRTVAGVARSLGAPSVTVRGANSATLMSVVVAWDLCWYRYEVELSDNRPTPRAAGQGYELTELDPADHVANAAADEHGLLYPAAEE